MADPTTQQGASPTRETKILATYCLSDLEHKDVPLWYHTQGRRQTASGYGCKLTTPTMVRLPGNPRWRRVYCCIFSNAGTCYVTVGKNWVVIR